MRYAVVLYLDEASSAIVRSLWTKLAEADISSYLLQIGVPPHVTLGTCEDLRVEGFLARMRAIAEEHQPFPLALSSLGTFPAPEGVVFLGVTSSDPLMRIAISVQEALGSFSSSVNRIFEPGVWVPHCTLAFGLPLDKIPRAVGECQHVPLPTIATVESTALVEVPSGNEIAAYPLQA